MVLIDLAVPRDIDPACGELDGVTLLDMDALQTAVRRHLRVRRAEAARAGVIVEEEIQAFAGWLGTLDVMRHKVEVLREHCQAVGRDPSEIEFSLGIKATIRDSEAEADRVMRAALEHNRTPMSWIEAARSICTCASHSSGLRIGTPNSSAKRLFVIRKPVQ